MVGAAGFEPAMSETGDLQSPEQPIAQHAHMVDPLGLEPRKPPVYEQKHNTFIINHYYKYIVIINGGPCRI